MGGNDPVQIHKGERGRFAVATKAARSNLSVIK
jgi:hypothetical protein